jgi:hypothetical protein
MGLSSNSIQPTVLDRGKRSNQISGILTLLRVGLEVVSPTPDTPQTPLRLSQISENRLNNLGLDLIVYLGGRRGLASVVKAAGWLSLDRQFEPYPRAITVAPSWCGLGCRSRTLMVEYISPWFFIS